jgi:hypothetical protein
VQAVINPDNPKSVARKHVAKHLEGDVDRLVKEYLPQARQEIKGVAAALIDAHGVVPVGRVTDDPKRRDASWREWRADGTTALENVVKATQKARAKLVTQAQGSTALLGWIALENVIHDVRRAELEYLSEPLFDASEPHPKKLAEIRALAREELAWLDGHIIGGIVPRAYHPGLNDRLLGLVSANEPRILCGDDAAHFIAACQAAGRDYLFDRNLADSGLDRDCEAVERLRVALGGVGGATSRTGGDAARTEECRAAAWVRIPPG